MARFFTKDHERYEELLMEHLDGRLDADGESRLQAHMQECSDCAVELQELEAATTLVRSQPQAEPPRSFALPLTASQPTPQRAPLFGGLWQWVGAGSAALLRSMQVATAAAALFLVALVGMDVTGVVGGPESQSFAGGDGASQDMRGMEAEPEAAPQDDSSGAIGPSILEEPPAEDSDGGRQEQPAQPALSVDRGVLEWAKLGLSGLTALLAIGVVWLTWHIHRSPF